MSQTLRIGHVPEYLRTAVEYRDQLMAELAKVNEFIRVAGRGPVPDEGETPDFMLLGGAEVAEIGYPGRPRRYADC